MQAKITSIIVVWIWLALSNWGKAQGHEHTKQEPGSPSEEPELRIGGMEFSEILLPNRNYWNQYFQKSNQDPWSTSQRWNYQHQNWQTKLRIQRSKYGIWTAAGGLGWSNGKWEVLAGHLRIQGDELEWNNGLLFKYPSSLVQLFQPITQITLAGSSFPNSRWEGISITRNWGGKQVWMRGGRVGESKLPHLSAGFRFPLRSGWGQSQLIQTDKATLGHHRIFQESAWGVWEATLLHNQHKIQASRFQWLLPLTRWSDLAFHYLHKKKTVDFQDGRTAADQTSFSGGIHVYPKRKTEILCYYLLDYTAQKESSEWLGKVIIPLGKYEVKWTSRGGNTRNWLTKLEAKGKLNHHLEFRTGLYYNGNAPGYVYQLKWKNKAFQLATGVGDNPESNSLMYAYFWGPQFIWGFKNIFPNQRHSYLLCTYTAKSKIRLSWKLETTYTNGTYRLTHIIQSHIPL